MATKRSAGNQGREKKTGSRRGKRNPRPPASASLALRRLPSVDRVLSRAADLGLLGEVNRDFLVGTVRSVIAELRRELRQGKVVTGGDGDGMEVIMDRVTGRLVRKTAPVAVINATGIVLHTNLGRAQLADEVVEAVSVAARNAVALEYNVERGARGERDELVEEDLLTLTGAEAATVVNNNAAALLLALNTLAQGKEVIVSRGELIEIGGSFRLPEVMAKSGAILREVGTTNRTHLRDYRKAAGPESGMLLKVHTSNYRVVGFTASVSLESLVALGSELKLPVVEDLGSGALVDLQKWGLPREPVVAERVAAGADLVTFSGDKLLGGPQAGIVVGRRDLVKQLRGNPLRRALRPDKLTLAALKATLSLYIRAPDIAVSLPTLWALRRPLPELREVASRAAARLSKLLGGGYSIEVEEATAQAGSGSLPAEEIPSVVIAVSSTRVSADSIAERFRRSSPPIIGRVHAGRFLLDVRLVRKAEELVPIEAAQEEK